MFNLLPESLKNNIKKDYTIRRIMVICAFLIFIGATFLILLFPSWMISFYKEKQISLEIQQNNQATLAEDVKAVDMNIKKINLELKTIDTALEYKKVIPIVNTILSNKTRSIYINSLDYDSKSPTSATILVEGISLTRGALLSFVKSLEDTKSFKSVDLPISNFAKDKNINFSITLILEP